MRRITLLRRCLLLAALAFAVYLISSVRPTGTRPQKGGEEVAQTLLNEIGTARDRMRFRDFQFEEDRNDGEGFRLTASEAVGYREGGEDFFRLKDVVLEFRGSDPRSRGMVVGAPRAEFKQTSKAMKVFDGVFVERQGLSLSSLSFRYDPTKKALFSEGPVTVVQGRMIALAQKGLLESLSGSIVLDGSVTVGGHDPSGRALSIRARSVRVAKDGALSASGGVTVKSDDFIIRGDRVERGVVEAGESIQASGSVFFVLRPSREAGRVDLVTARGSGLEIIREAAGPPRNMVLEDPSGLAQIDSAAPDSGGSSRRLLSPRFEARFQGGKLAEIAIPEALRGLEAPLPVKDQKAGFREVTASRARITYAQDGKTVEVAAFEGPVTATEAGRKATVKGSSASYRGATNDLVVSGAGTEPAVFSEPAAKVEARVLTYQIRDEVLEAEGAVRASFQGTSSVALPGSRPSEPYFSESESLRLLMKKKELVLAGSVRAWQRENVLRASKLILSDVERRVFAEGNVRATFRRSGGTSSLQKSLLNSGEIINATSDRLIHVEQSHIVRLEGNSTVLSGQWQLAADLSEFHLADDSTIQYAEAKGAVVMEDRLTKRRGEGGKALWMPQTELVTLQGNPAKAVDGQGNRVEGAVLLFRPGKARVDVETSTGVRSEGVFRPEGS